MLTRRSFCKLSGAAALAPGAAARQHRPNIVLILADDLGYGDVGYLNPRSKIPTPAINRLASEGIHFTDAHDPTALCSPTRYGIMTGRYCWRSALKNGVLHPWDKPIIEKQRVTLPGLLQSRGYDTMAIGKWHLGWNWPTTDGQEPRFANNTWNLDFHSRIADGPTDRGFHRYFGPDVPNNPPYCFIENDRTIGIPSEPLPVAKLVAEAPGRGFGTLQCQPGPALPDWQFVKILPALTERAVDYLDERAQHPETPFFLYLPLTSPHMPIVPAPEFHGKSGAGPYGDWVAQTDATVGRVLEALDRNHLAHNTLVLFASDNGPQEEAYDRARIYGHYSMDSWRGVKWDVWEGGHRVPVIARWPGQTPPGASSSETICLTDLMATVATIVGAHLPADAGEDSYNILPALRNQKLKTPIREATVLHSGRGHFSLRQRNWMFIDNPTGGDNPEPEWFKKERNYLPDPYPGELYDLAQDPAERVNLYGQKPEIVAHMKALLETYKLGPRTAPRI